jgi:serine/threonine-protein kinase
MPIDLDQEIGPYRIVSQLGRGGTATVYKAYQPALDRHVAIKVLNANQATPDFIARFKREARIIAKLDHPNIIPIYDIEEYDGSLCLIMRYVEGLSLKEALSRLKQPLKSSAILRILNAVTDALGYAHQKNILHRDVKPSNIMLAQDERIYLMDFGLAVGPSETDLNLSKGMVMGTPYYISPEQAKGESLDQRTDIYSLGVVLYELLTGKVPFTGDTYDVVVYHQIFSLPQLPSAVNPRISPAAERVVLTCLAKDKEDRYFNVQDMMRALQSAFQSTAQTSSPTPRGDAKPATPFASVKPQFDVTDIRAKPIRRGWSGSGVLLVLALFLLGFEVLFLIPGFRSWLRDALVVLASSTENTDVTRIIIGTLSAYVATVVTSIIVKNLKRRLTGVAFILAIAFGVTLIIALVLGFLVLSLLNLL